LGAKNKNLTEVKKKKKKKEVNLEELRKTLKESLKKISREKEEGDSKS